MKLTLTILLHCSIAFLASAQIDNEKIFHFELNGIDDTLDIINRIPLELSGDYSSDTNRFGVAESAIFLHENSAIEIPNNNTYNLDEDSSFTVSFWITPTSVEFQEFFFWAPISYIHYNWSLFTPTGNVELQLIQNEPLLLTTTYNKRESKTYLNGEKMSEGTIGLWEIFTPNTALKITTPRSNFEFSIDELIMYKGALDSNEVFSIYNEVVLSTNEKIDFNKITYSIQNNTLSFNSKVDEVQLIDFNGKQLLNAKNTNQIILPNNESILILRYFSNGQYYSEKIKP